MTKSETAGFTPSPGITAGSVSKASAKDQVAGATKNILIGESGDILARYRIPVENNHVDYALQLPEDSDSSNFSSEENEEGDKIPAIEVESKELSR